MADQISQLFMAATDLEATIVQSLAERVGLRWTCRCGYWNVTDRLCDGCGQPRFAEVEAVRRAPQFDELSSLDPQRDGGPVAL